MAREKLYIIKIGGNIVDDPGKLTTFLKAYAAIREKKILVHGGGKLATKLAQQLNIEQELIEGRRVTNAETLDVVTMVYAGLINKKIVAQLQSNGCNAIGITGADGNAILAHKRVHPTIDYGFVGDIDKVNDEFLNSILQQGLSLVIAPLTHNKEGQLLNTNADTIAQELSRALSASFEVDLVYCFEKNGVLKDADNDATVIPSIDATLYTKLKNEGVIFAGMIPKLDNAFVAINSGISKVIIGKAEQINQLIKGETGTTIH